MNGDKDLRVRPPSADAPLVAAQEKSLDWPKAAARLGTLEWRPDPKIWERALKARPKGRTTDAALKDWMAGPLRRYLPFTHAMIAYGELEDGAVVVKKRVALGYAEAHVAELPARMQLDDRSCAAHWLKTQVPLLMDPAKPPPFMAPHEIEMAGRFGLGLMAAHGVIDPMTSSGSYVALSGLSAETKAHAVEVMETIAPILHGLFLRTLEKPKSKLEQAGLTPRQMQIARLAAAGKDDKTIARELGVSEHTVSTHLRSIFRKLNVSKRGQLTGV